MFLTPKELHALTGYYRRSKQIAWLRSNGIEPFLSATGAVHVAREVVTEVQRRMSGIEVRAAARKGPLPNFSVVK